MEMNKNARAMRMPNRVRCFLINLLVFGHKHTALFSGLGYRNDNFESFDLSLVKGRHWQNSRRSLLNNTGIGRKESPQRGFCYSVPSWLGRFRLWRMTRLLPSFVALTVGSALVNDPAKNGAERHFHLSFPKGNCPRYAGSQSCDRLSIPTKRSGWKVLGASLTPVGDRLIFGSSRRH